MHTASSHLALAFVAASVSAASAQTEHAEPPSLTEQSAQLRQADTIDTIVHTSFVVDRPAGRVWPVLIDLPAWKSSIAELDHVEGEVGKEGELRFVTLANAGAEPGYLIQTVRLVPAQQLVLKVFPRDRAGYLGFADVSLRESAGKTRVDYNVYVEYRVPGTTPEQRVALTKQIHDATKAKLETENLVLKSMVERGVHHGEQDPPVPRETSH